MRHYFYVLMLVALVSVPSVGQARKFKGPSWYVVMDHGSWMGENRYGIINGPYADKDECAREAKRISDEAELYMECIYMSEATPDDT